MAAEKFSPAWLAASLLSVGAPLTLAAQALAEPLNSSVGAKQASCLLSAMPCCLVLLTPMG